ncbi:hypothetical protein J6590_023650 [Homalodisca vitripennis]|nr:hypothetical protein J6590_023650 [Homalodisca vitripennis]
MAALENAITGLVPNSSKNNFKPNCLKESRKGAAKFDFRTSHRSLKEEANPTSSKVRFSYYTSELQPQHLLIPHNKGRPSRHDGDVPAPPAAPTLRTMGRPTLVPTRSSYGLM